MSSNRFSAQSHPRRNAIANLKRRSDDRRRVGGFQGYPPQQKRARTQPQTLTRFPSANAYKVPLYHRSSIPRVSDSYDSNVFAMSGSYVHGLGSSNVSSNVAPNRSSPLLSNNGVSVPLSSSQPMTNYNHQYLSGYGNCDPQRASNSLPRQMRNDLSLDSLPEWNPNEPTSQTRNGFTPIVMFDNFPVRSPNFVRHGSVDSFGYASVDPMAKVANLPYSMPSNREIAVSLLPQVMPDAKQPLISNELSDLLSKIKNRGLVSPNERSSQDTGVTDSRGGSALGTEFDTSLLRVRHESVINALYSDLPRQCASCGVRFRCQEDHRDHMDWHVRKNRMAKDTGKSTRQSQKPKKSRKWLASAGLRLSAATGEPLDDGVVAELFNAGKETQEKQEEEEFVVPADDDQRTCALCEEPFEDFFSEEADEWMYKGTVYLHMHNKRTETRTGMNMSMLGPIVHAKCMPENRKASTQDLGKHKSIPVSIPSARALVC